MQRGIYPFWFWNSDQEEQETLRQLEMFADINCQGVILHGREGNQLPYMSDAWLALIRSCCQKAKELNLKLWLYDEEGYPSGNVGGRIPAEFPELLPQSMDFEYGKITDDVFAAYHPQTLKRITGKEFSGAALCLKKRTGFRHVDVLNKRSCEEFMRRTHLRWEKHLGEYLGNVLECVYTDDVSIFEGYLDGIPWSDTLPEAYQKQYGRDLLQDLPFLIEKRQESEAAEQRFYGLLQKLFLENFVIPQQNWCHKHGLIYLGHLTGDEGGMDVSFRRYVSAQPFYRQEDIPSIDDYVCNRIDQRYLLVPFSTGKDRFVTGACQRLTHVLLTWKLAESVADQFANGLLSAETIAGLGWKISPQYVIRQMFFEIAMGANLLTPHAFYYTVSGSRRLDSPPSYGTQQPWLSIFGKFNVIWKRTAELLAWGKNTADTLIVLPDHFAKHVSAMELKKDFIPQSPLPSPGILEIEQRLTRLVLNLFQHAVEFHISDAQVLALDPETGKIRVGDCVYSNVYCLNDVKLPEETLRLLAESKSRIRKEHDPIETSLPITLKADPEILTRHRKMGDKHLLFLQNLSGKTQQIEYESAQKFTLYDPEKHCTSQEQNKFVLMPWQNVFMLPEDQVPTDAGHAEKLFSASSITRPAQLCDIRLQQKNMLLVKDDRRFILAPGMSITAVCSENEAPVIDPAVSLLQMPEHHPCDSHFKRYTPASPFPETFSISNASPENPIWLEGDFICSADSTLQPSPLPGAGDLSKQGFSNYWGSVRYTYQFDGRHQYLCAIFNGIATVKVNGIDCGVLTPDGRVEISSAAVEDKNTVELELFNTAQNLLDIDNEPVPFGVSAVLLAD